MANKARTQEEGRKLGMLPRCEESASKGWPLWKEGRLVPRVPEPSSVLPGDLISVVFYSCCHLREKTPKLMVLLGTEQAEPEEQH